MKSPKKLKTKKKLSKIRIRKFNIAEAGVCTNPLHGGTYGDTGWQACK